MKARFYQLPVRPPEARNPELARRTDRVLATAVNLFLTRRRFLEGVGAVLSLFSVRGGGSIPGAAKGSRFLCCWSPRAPAS